MPHEPTAMARRVALRRRPLYVLLAAAAVVVAAWAFWPRALPVETSTVVRAPLVVGFREEGRTRVLERYVLSAPLDGVVQRITLEPGDEVRLGAQVALLRPIRAALLDPANRAQTQARLDAAQSELASARATEVSAREERRRTAMALARGTALANGRLISQSDLDTLQSQAATAESALRAAGARVRTLTVLRNGTRAALSLQGAAVEGTHSLVLRAPIDGRVMRRHVESESPVRAGQPLLEIGDPRALEVIADVLTEDAARLRRGADVRITRWGGDVPLHGRIRAIEPGGFTKVSALGVEEQRTTVVVALVDDAARYRALGDAFRVEAEFIAWRGESVLQVPVAALFRDGTHWATYVVDHGRARLRRVDVGHIGESAAQLRAGLQEGAIVIAYPADEVRDGMRVRAQD